MRRTLDLSGLIIPESNLIQCNKCIETYSSNKNQIILASQDKPEFSKNDLVELRKELMKLKARLLNNHENYTKKIQPILSTISFFENPPVVPGFQSGIKDMKRNTQGQPTQKSAQPKNPNYKDNYKKLNQKNSYQNQNARGGSERSVRGHSRDQNQQNTGNPLDIWWRAAPLFATLPSQEEVRSVFDTIIEKSIKSTSMRMEIPKEPIQHWSKQLMENMSRMTIKESKKMPKLLPPPGPPPAATDVAEYWKTHTPLFPIQDIQKKNAHTMHRLLSSLVETDPAQMPKKSLSEPRKQYLPMNALAPKLEYDSYLRLDFDERLELELKDAGLDESVCVKMNDDNSFNDEIVMYKQQLLQLIPDVEKASRMLTEKIPLFRKQEDQHFIDQAMFEELYQTSQKKHKKK